MVLAAVLLLASACTSSSSDGAPTKSVPSDTPTTLDSLSDLVDVCRTEMLRQDPDILRLAIDPAITGYALSLPVDAVTEAAEQLYDCLAVERGAEYLASDLIITGQPLPPETKDCFAPLMSENGPLLIEMSLRWSRLEVPTAEVGDVFIDAMTECVPGRFLAAPILGENPTGYGLAVDTDCLDQAHVDNGEPMLAFWTLQAYSGGAPDPSLWTDEEAKVNVAPLYACIDTGTLIATDPTIGASLSGPTRDCIGGAAQANGFWESRLAQRDFDEDAYRDDITECLSPEEAEAVLGIPVPTDDPETSNFAVVDECYEPTIDETLDEHIEAIANQPEELSALALELTGCAGPGGVAGRYASIQLGRALPEGTYDCFLPLAEADPATMLEGKLFDEAGVAPSPVVGTVFADAISTCVAPSVYTRPVFLVLTSPAILDTVDLSCVDDSLATGTQANTAYWATYVDVITGSITSEAAGASIEQAAIAVAPLYDCVAAGSGFADVAGQTGADLSETTIECIDASIREIQSLELAILGLSLEEGVLNGAIADCLTEDEVEQLQGG